MTLAAFGAKAHEDRYGTVWEINQGSADCGGLMGIRVVPDQSGILYIKDAIDLRSSRISTESNTGFLLFLMKQTIQITSASMSVFAVKVVTLYLDLSRYSSR